MKKDVEEIELEITERLVNTEPGLNRTKVKSINS